MSASLVFLAAMEIAKLHALASYCFLPLGLGVPYIGASAAFVVSLVLGRSLRRTGMRVIFSYLAQAAAFAALLAAVYGLRAGFPPAEGRTADFAAVAAALAVHWLRAAWLGAREARHAFCAARFDEGMTLFLVAFILAALTRFENPFAGRLVIPFFVFGILALGASQGEGSRRGGFGAGARLRPAFSVAAAFVLSALALAALVPALSEPARRAADSLGAAAGSFMEAFGNLLLRLFRPADARFADSSPSGPAPPAAPPPGGAGGSSFAALAFWALAAVVGAAALLIVGYLAWRLVLFLASRTKATEGAPAASSPFRVILKALRVLAAALSRLFGRPSARGGERSPALAAYVRLLAGGRAAGRARRPSETPREYARRLAAAFPRAAGQADFVAEAVEREVYGGLPADAETAGRLAALRPRMSRRSFLAERIRRRRRG